MFHLGFQSLKDFANPKTLFKASHKAEQQSKNAAAATDDATGKLTEDDKKPKPVDETPAPAETHPQPQAQPKAQAQVEKAVAESTIVAQEPENHRLADTLPELNEVPAKHPLENTWTLWYLENDRTKTWEDMQNEITSFNTVEDFWSLYNHIKMPSEIKLGSDYSMFKKGIRPMWEDAANKLGGRWVINNISKSATTELDNFWIDILLCLIGEAFENSNEICGAVVNIRAKNNKISVWTANGSNEAAAMEIGQKLKDTLRLGRHYQLQYQLHKDTMAKTGSNVKSIYTL